MIKIWSCKLILFNLKNEKDHFKWRNHVLQASFYFGEAATNHLLANEKMENFMYIEQIPKACKGK